MKYLNVKKVTMISLFIFIMSGCTTTKLLKTNFGLDDDKSFPDLLLPGSPTGDRMYWYGSPIIRSGVQPLEVKVSADGTHLLRFTRTRADEPGPYILGFAPSDRNFTKGAYILQWKVNVGKASNRPAYVKITNGNTFESPTLLELEIIAPGRANSDGQDLANVYMGHSPNPIRPGRRDQIGSIRTDRETAFTIVLNIQSRLIKISASNVNISQDFPTEINLSMAPSIWFSYGTGEWGFQSFKYVKIFHTVRTED